MPTIKVGDEAFGNGEFKLIPAGSKLRMSVFDTEVTTVKSESSPNKGSKQLVVTAKVTEDGEFKGREIRYNNIPLYYSEKNAWVLVTFAEAVGWPVDLKDKSVDVPDNFQGILGTEFVGTVGQRTGQNGTTYNTVSRYAVLSEPVEGETTKTSWSDV
jgi:hypothetical protein